MMDIAEIRKKAQREREGRRDEPRTPHPPAAPATALPEEADEVLYDGFFPPEEIVPPFFAPATAPVVRDPLAVILEGRKAALVDEVLPAEADVSGLLDTR